MPTTPKKKKRPWLPTNNSIDRSKGLKPQSRSTDEFVRFYNSKQWKSLRNYYIQMHPLCVEHERMGYIVPATDIDHIIPMRFGGSQTALSNLQSLCRECHMRKSGKESHIPTPKK